MNEAQRTYEKINTSKIFTAAYQRPVDMRRVKKMANLYNPNLVNPVKVSLRDGKYWCFDGNHTKHMLILRNGNKDLDVDCDVYRGLTYEEEAELFSLQTGLSRAVGSNKKLKALYEAKDVDVTEFVDCVRNAGLRVDFDKRTGGNGNIVACSALFKIFKKTNASDFNAILVIIRDAWNMDDQSLRKEILNGVYIFYTTYKPDINTDLAIDHFSKISPTVIIREGKASQTSGDTKYAVQLLKAYNKGLRYKLDAEKLFSK